MKTRLTLVLVALTATRLCCAQGAETHVKEATRSFFHLSFVVKEVEDSKVVNSRTYVGTLSTEKGGGNAMVRTGSKIPIQKGGGEISYIDLGVSLDYRFVAEIGNSLVLNVSADISSVATDSTPGPLGPVIRQNRWGSEVVVPVGKPVTIFSSDDLTSKRKMQVEVTATPITP